MIKSDTHAFVNQVLVCLLVTIGFGGSIGLGTVWMRHQISITANSKRLLSAELAALKRLTEETNALVEVEQRPEVLRQRNADWRLGMAPVSEGQVAHVTEDLVRRLRARANRDLYDRGANDSAAAMNIRLSFAQ
ncbi:MAG: hypothetical protein RIQ93_478 [Verrucomicrobiota bacterium]|jgi:hypothetical protein